MADPDLRSFYSDEAGRYEQTRYGSSYGHLFRVLQREEIRAGLGRRGCVLDVATGTGQMLPVLAASADVVVATDLTPGMLGEARARMGAKRGIVYCVASAGHLPCGDGTFDAVASSRFLHLFPVEVQAELVREMARVMKPGAVLLVDFYSADGRRIFAGPIALYRRLLSKRPEHDHRVTLQEGRAMAYQAGLEVVDMVGIGNFLLLLVAWLPFGLRLRLGRWLGRRWPSGSEQFLIVARKP